MRYEEAAQILTNQSGREDRQLVQAAKVVLTNSAAEKPHTAMARLALRDVRTRMWHADQTMHAIDTPIGRPAVTRPQTLQAALSVYKFNLIEILAVVSASLFVLYLGLTCNIFSNPEQVRAETLEIGEVLLFLAVMLFGSFWAGSRLVNVRRHA